MSADYVLLVNAILKRIKKRIVALDQAQRYEDSYAITQEFREWLLDPRMSTSDCTGSPALTMPSVLVSPTADVYDTLIDRN